MLQKIGSLAAILRRDPREFMQRVATIAEGRVEPLRVPRGVYTAADPEDALELLASAFGPHVRQALAEPALERVEAQVRARLHELRPRAPYTLAHNADFTLARCCYIACRATAASRVVETGVGYGVTSAFLLAALRENGGGRLDSIDIPPLERGSDAVVGALVPPDLTDSWTVHRGMSRRVLPAVLAEAGPIDVFVHDSQHTYDNMRFEMDAAWSRLREGGVLLSDDVEWNAAFTELRARGPRVWGVFDQADKPAMFGMAVR
jgi:predicted O-methyltransferase YrrM